jgi:hypothetical protein
LETHTLCEMKKTLLFLLLLIAISAQAQRKKEFQIRGGFGFAAYATTTEFTYSAFGLTFTTKNDDGAATVHMPLELRYEISQRFNLGLDMKWGSYLYEPDSGDGKSNKFFVIGVGLEYNFINADNFRWYGGLGFNSASLELEENSTFGSTPVKQITRWSGGGFRLNSGVLYFFAGALGLNFNLGYDSHNFSLDEFEVNGQSQNLSGIDGSLDVGGMDLTLGLAVRF